MEKIKAALKDTKFWIICLVVITFFGIFVKMEYATDTYCVFGTPAKQMIEHFVKSGRFVTAMAQAVLTFSNFGKAVSYSLSFILAIICTIISIYKLYKIFAKDISSNVLAVIVSILIVVNTFSIELYLFLEKGILWLSVLMCVLAFEKMVMFFEHKQKAKSFILAFIYMVIASFSYQGTVALFVALSCIYIVKYSKTIKEFIVNNLITALCYGIPALINYVIVAMLGNTRVSGEYNIVLSIKKIFENTKEMLIHTYNILPDYMFIITLGIVILIGIIYFIRQKENVKKKMLLIFGLIYVILATFIVTIFPQIMQSTDSIGFAPRSTYAFAALIGIVLVYILINVEVHDIIKKLLIILLVGFLGVQYISFINIARDRYIVNYMDYNQFLQIQEIVYNYEEETGNTIEKVAIYTNNNVQGTYPDIFISGDINLKAMCPAWSRIDYLEYFFGRTLEAEESSDEIYETYFKDKNWKFFDKDQVILKDNVMHIYVY